MRHEDLPRELNEFADRLIGAAIEVRREPGPGFLERTYEMILTHELQLCGMAVAQQVEIVVRSKGLDLPGHRLDLFVEKQIVVDLKAVEPVVAVHFAQMVRSLRAGDCPLGLHLNFGLPELKDGICRRINKSSSVRSASLRSLCGSAWS
ncbi:MAG: GxxExxY protein [Leptolyngbya sp. PLA3]|nr:MAG: GxxExxY protein [Cyanobacteria bacterium CYA]MCE7969439.1 GxxExxY protein [Leptolyngbya sp. PL-A3]